MIVQMNRIGGNFALRKRGLYKHQQNEDRRVEGISCNVP
jgi:hypothetical protein